MIDDNKSISQLPKPITMTGSAFEDPNEKTEIDDIEEHDEELIDEESNSEDVSDDLPEPAVFGEGDEDIEEIDPKVKIEDYKPEESRIASEQVNDNQSKIESYKVPEKSLEPVENEITESPLNLDIPKIEVEAEEKEEINKETLNDDIGLEKDKTEETSIKTEIRRPILQTSVEDSLDSNFTNDNQGNDFDIPALNSNPAPNMLNSSAEQYQAETDPNDSTIPSNNVLGSSQENFAEDDTTFNLNQLGQETALPSDVSTITHPEQQLQQEASVISDPGVNPGYQGINYGQYAAQAPVANQVDTKSSGFPKVLMGVLGVFVGGGLVIGGYFTANKIFNKGETSAPLQAVSETVSPTPTPSVVPQTPIPATEEEKAAEKTDKTVTKATEDKDEAIENIETKIEDLQIKVLNGSGTKGAAKSAKTLLTKAGFENIDTGNADNFEYKKTYINYKPEHESFIDDIDKALGSSYQVVKDEELEEDDKYDFYIILGESKEATSSTKD
jgi:hypothetical protein